jgi:uncharacterized membrane protein
VSEKQTFWGAMLELFKSSVIVQSLLTLVVVGTICILVLTARVIPEELWALTGVIVGYWFGSKNNITMQKMVEAQAKAQSETVERMCSELERLAEFTANQAPNK